MFFSAKYSQWLHRALILGSLLTAIGLVPVAGAQDDPPPMAGRLSSLNGSVQILGAGSETWAQAGLNLPLSVGDRIVTDENGRAELQIGQSLLRLGAGTDLTIVDLSGDRIAVGLGQGSLRIRANDLWPGQQLHLHTPNGDASLRTAGEFRADVLTQDQLSMITDYNGDLLLSGAGDFRMHLRNGQSMELAGVNPVQPMWMQPAAPDQLDYWSQERDQRLARVQAYQYMSREIPGAEELDQYGLWLPGTEYGAVWFPNNLPAGWSPYHYGHWMNRQPWGWVWVEDEPWGYAPFHYGRWVQMGGRWGWVPGPPTERPVWSPALVAFAGDNHNSAWIPLGPGEPYHPWYHCSPQYVERVNISNIRPAPMVHLESSYFSIDIGRVRYANRDMGMVAMRNDDFAAGRPVQYAPPPPPDWQRNNHDRVIIIERPVPVPVPQARVIGPPPPRPVIVNINNPVFINEGGQQIGGRPGMRPVTPPVNNNPVPARPMPGRQPQPNPQNGQQPNQPGNGFGQMHPTSGAQPPVGGMNAPLRPGSQPGQNPQSQQPVNQNGTGTRPGNNDGGWQNGHGNGGNNAPANRPTPQPGQQQPQNQSGSPQPSNPNSYGNRQSGNGGNGWGNNNGGSNAPATRPTQPQQPQNQSGNVGNNNGGSNAPVNRPTQPQQPGQQQPQRPAQSQPQVAPQRPAAVAPVPTQKPAATPTPRPQTQPAAQPAGNAKKADAPKDAKKTDEKPHDR